MANFLEDKNRRVIPNWRSFNKTSHLGELDSFNIKNNAIRILMKKFISMMLVDNMIQDFMRKVLVYQ